MAWDSMSKWLRLIYYCVISTDVSFDELDLRVQPLMTPVPWKLSCLTCAEAPSSFLAAADMQEWVWVKFTRHFQSLKGPLMILLNSALMLISRQYTMRKGPSQKNALIIVIDEIKVICKGERKAFAKSMWTWPLELYS